MVLYILFGAFVLVLVLSLAFSIRPIVRLFDKGNVCVCGLRGSGKDVLFGNVIARKDTRKRKAYISNLDYGGKHIPLDLHDFDCGENAYKDFIDGKVKQYVFPFPEGTDLYISDCGVYFPSQYCNELNRDYKYFPTYFALSRQVSHNNVHVNAQNLNRVWDKIREQSDTYIYCRWCKVLFRGRLVIQKVTVYDKMQSCIDRVKPFSMSLPLFGKDSKTNIKLEKERFTQTYGSVKNRIMIYRNKSKHDTYMFEYLLRKGVLKDGK